MPAELKTENTSINGEVAPLHLTAGSERVDTLSVRSRRNSDANLSDINSEHSESKKDKKAADDKPTVLSGIYIFPNGDRYEGEYVHGSDGSIERSGHGVHTSVDGTVYTGDWRADKMNGNGRLEHTSGALYEGDFNNNQFNGKGKYVFPNKSFYEGDFMENKMEGEGHFTDTEGQVWVGTFRYKAAPGLKFKLNLD